MQTEFSNVLRAARKKAKLTQKQLASLLGVATGTVQQWELGVRFPRVEMLTKLEEKLDMALVPTVIEEDEQYGTMIYLNYDAVKESQQRKLLQWFDLLNEKGRRTAIERVAELSKIDEYKRITLTEPLAEDEQQKSPTEQEKPSAGQ